MNSSSPFRSTKLLLIVISLALTILIFIFVSPHLTLDELKKNYAQFQQFHSEKPLVTMFYFVLAYATLTFSGLPGITALNLFSGALFGVGWGTAAIVMASTLGALSVFLFSRGIFRSWIMGRFGSRLSNIQKKLETDGVWYLLSVRLIPFFPIHLVNIAMGLSQIPLRQFVIVTAVGLLPGTLVYTFTGQELSKVESLQDVFTLKMTLLFIGAALFPWCIKAIINRINGKQKA